LKDEWKKHIRELKVLRAKKKAGGWLPPKEAKRLEWLEERFGDAPEIERIQVDEPVDAGPKITTADHGYATEVSEKLLSEAEKYKLKKAWEKDEERKKRAFEARDRREGKATFKQEGLSGFAVEATEDMKEGEIGLAETPQEEEAQQKIQHGQVVYAQDESERLTKKSEGDSSPFALNISDSLTRGLEKHRNYKEETVPDTAAKSFEVEVDDEELAALDNLDRAPTKAEDLSEELQGLLKKSYELPKDEVKSEGEMSTHAVGTSAEEMSTFDLMRQAVDFAETQGTVEEEAQVFEIDEEGKAIPYEDQVEDLTAGMGDTGTGETVEAELPMPPPPPPPEPPKKKHRFSDTAPTRPGVAPSELVTEMGEALPDPAAAEPDDLAVLIPDPTDSLPEEEEILEVDDDEILEVDSDEIIEVEPEIEMEIDHSSQAEVAAAMEPQPRGEDIDVDDFWGAAEDAPPAEPPTIPEQEKPEPPKYRPKKPLPALNVAAQRPAAKRSEAVPIGAPRPAPKPAPKAVDHKEIDALFSEAEIDAGADEEIATIAPAKPKAAKPFAEGTTQPVDLPPGPRKATVHFKDGVTRRGVIGQFDTDADLIRLDPPANSSAPAEDLIALALKTIFLMVPRGASKPRVNGASVRLVLIDGRSLEGVTTDYDPHRKAFTLFPKGARGNIERIIVFNDAVKNIWFD
jgi:hypothetical protein